MFLLREPSISALKSFLHAQQGQSFSYQEIGASREQTHAGYDVDHNRVLLGSGEEAFGKAIAALRAWKMFDLGWCRIYPSNAPIEVGTTVAILINHFGFWSLNASRIVYVIDEDGLLRRYGFAYGTLAEHGEIGEERFSVEWKQEDGSVWYDLYAFSTPGHILAKFGYPLSRRLQKRFIEGSKMAMGRAVKNGSL